MGLFDTIKNTAQSAVNSVTGNQTTPSQQEAVQQPQQEVEQQPQQEVEQQPQQGVAQQPQQEAEQPQQEVEQQSQQEMMLQPQQETPQQTDPTLSFMGKTYRNPGGGPLAKGTRFFEDHIEFGTESFSYSDLSEITISHMPTVLASGTAQTLYKPGNRAISMTFFNDVPGFLAAVDYANGNISEASGSSAGRKFLLRSPDGSKLEIYEDYIATTVTGKGLSAVISHNDNTNIIMFKNVVSLSAASGTQLEISYKTDSGEPVQFTISFASSDAELVNEIISYVQNYTPDLSDEIEEETWKFVTGNVREFPILGKQLVVNENWDVFNSYRKIYMNCAAAYTQQLEKKYVARVNNFETFMKFYIPLYKEYLEKMINKTTDILVSAGIWTETSESIMQRHVAQNHLAMDDYTTLYDSLMLTVQNNKNKVAAVTSFVPNLVGGGFGLKGAAVGIAKATAFNLLRDGAEAALIDSMNISAAQKAELYGRINQKVLFERAFLDMWRVFQTLIDIMNENGKNIWFPTDADSAKADNIMKNISNPNFPQEQFPDVMVAVIGMNPYKKSIYELLISRGADENEVRSISEYFGYTETTPDFIR